MEIYQAEAILRVSCNVMPIRVQHPNEHESRIFQASRSHWYLGPRTRGPDFVQIYQQVQLNLSFWGLSALLIVNNINICSSTIRTMSSLTGAPKWDAKNFWSGQDFQTSARLHLQHWIWNYQLGFATVHPKIEISSGEHLEVADIGAGNGFV
jgi:hypothetical protein